MKDPELSDAEIERLAGMALDMLIAVKREDYELASLHRDAIDIRLIKIADKMIEMKLTILAREDLIDELMSFKKKLISGVEDMLGVEEEDKIV